MDCYQLDCYQCYISNPFILLSHFFLFLLFFLYFLLIFLLFCILNMATSPFDKTIRYQRVKLVTNSLAVISRAPSGVHLHTNYNVISHAHLKLIKIIVIVFCKHTHLHTTYLLTAQLLVQIQTNNTLILVCLFSYYLKFAHKEKNRNISQNQLPLFILLPFRLS